MTFTPLPTVTDGDDLLDDWGNSASSAVTELQGIGAASATGAAITTSGTTEATVATVAFTPDVDGVLMCFGHLYRTQTVAGDQFDVRLLVNGVGIAYHRSSPNTTSPTTVNPVGMIAVTAGVAQTITMTIARQAGTGTATTLALNILNRLAYLFIPAP